MKKILTTIFVLAILFLVGKAFVAGMEKQERIDCETWDAQSKEFSGFYVTKDQDAQCKHWGIVINATVRE